jgi:hypothetical protein
MISEDDGTRTRNHRIDSPVPATPKPYELPDLRPIDPAGRSAGRSGDATEQAEGGPPLDAELATLVAAWPTLPDALRRAVVAIVGSHIPPAVAHMPTPAGDELDGFHQGYEPPVRESFR